MSELTTVHEAKETHSNLLIQGGGVHKQFCSNVRSIHELKHHLS
jgi:hypothetical protein